MTKDSTTHLEELYEYYRPQMDGVITADQILTGVKTKPDDELDFDQHFQLMMDILEEVKPVWNGKYNVLVEAKMNRLFDWVLDVMPFELGVMLVKMVREIIPFTDHLKYVKRTEELARHISLLS